MSLSLGGIVQLAHFCLVPETRIDSLVNNEARRLRKEESDKCSHVYGPGEIKGGPGMKEVLATWGRPFLMFATEPIVLWLSLLSGFSDALIFIFIDSFHAVFGLWGFGTIAHGMTFVPIVVGYVVAYVTYFPILRKHELVRRRDPHHLQPESRLVWLTYTAPLLAIGLFGFAAATMGPPIPWIVPMVFVFLVAIANFNIYMGTVDYMVAAYGPLSASATGGNALARDVLAGIAAMYSHPFYHSIGTLKWQKFWPTMILGVLALAFTVSVYVIYYKGPTIRAKSKMAQNIGHDREVADTRRSTLVPDDVQDIERALRNRQVAPTSAGQPPADLETNGASTGSETHASGHAQVGEAHRPMEPVTEVSELPGTTEDHRPS